MMNWLFNPFERIPRWAWAVVDIMKRPRLMDELGINFPVELKVNLSMGPSWAEAKPVIER